MTKIPHPEKTTLFTLLFVMNDDEIVLGKKLRGIGEGLSGRL